MLNANFINRNTQELIFTKTVKNYYEAKKLTYVVSLESGCEIDSLYIKMIFFNN